MPKTTIYMLLATIKTFLGPLGGPAGPAGPPPGHPDRGAGPLGPAYRGQGAHDPIAGAPLPGPIAGAPLPGRVPGPGAGPRRPTAAFGPGFRTNSMGIDSRNGQMARRRHHQEGGQAMRMRTLGGTGIKVSPYCLGAMMFGARGNRDHEESIRIIHAALER